MQSKDSDTFLRRLEFSNGSELKIWQASVSDVGGVVWDAALTLIHFIQRVYVQFPELLTEINLPEPQDKFVLELGAGTGAVGLKLAQCGFRVLVTDLESCLPLITHNITENNLTNHARCRALNWSSQLDIDVCLAGCPAQVDLIVVCDCLYYEDSVNSLFHCLSSLCTPNTPVLFAYEHRSDKQAIEQGFFDLLFPVFSITEIPSKYLDPDFSCPEISLLLLRRQSQEELNNLALDAE